MRTSLLLLALFLFAPLVNAAETTITELRDKKIPKGWDVEGYAFGNRKPGPERQNAARTTPNQQQYQKGKLASPELTVAGDYLVAEMDGVWHPEKLCVALVVDGEDVRRLNIKDKVADVKEFKGKKAKIEIRDNHANGWLNIGSLRFTDKVPANVKAQTKLPLWEDAVFETTADKKYMLLPVDSPNAPLQEVVLEIDGKELLRVDLPLSMDQEPAGKSSGMLPFYDLRDYQGKKVRLLYKKTAGSKTNNLIKLSDTLNGYPEGFPSDGRYPGFQLSCKFGKLNDPNGLVYLDGTYHLFFQYWFGPRAKFWAHYVSDDLVHWKERPVALFHDATGSMHSGSATVDVFNTTGWQKGDQKVIVAAATGSRGLGGNDKIQVQDIAYSDDGGKTFHKYEGNPVLGIDYLKTINSTHFRDPKVFWYSPTKGMDPNAKDGHWVMIVFEGSGHSLFTSSDLKKWKKTGYVTGFYECPEMFPLPVDDKKEDVRWVMYGADGAYHLGKFDGQAFTPETKEKIRYNYGVRHYASQTFSNVPPKIEGNPPRRVQVGWQGSIISFPVELTLRTTPLGVRLCSLPVEEIAKLYTGTLDLNGKSIKPGDANPLAKCKGGLYDIDLVAEVNGAKSLQLNICGNKATFDVAKKTFTFGKHKVVLPMQDGKLYLRAIVDNRNINFYVGKEGLFYLPAGNPKSGNKGLAIEVEGGPVKFDKLQIHSIKCIWDEP